jgi:hypothetical protein
LVLVSQSLSRLRVGSASPGKKVVDTVSPVPGERAVEVIPLRATRTVHSKESEIMLVCFDIDGTLANIDHRTSYVRSKPKNWKAFEAGIPYDSVNKPVARMFHALLADGATIILASGRGGQSRGATTDWLLRHGLSPWDKLYMREAGDYRSDVIVKREILDLIISDYGKKPDMVFDDRPGVVQMWRDEGIFVFDCYQGKEDF